MMNSIYNDYTAWCGSLGIQPASEEIYNREIMQIVPAAEGFNRWGDGLAVYKQKQKLHKSTFVTAGALADVLGIERSLITRVLIEHHLLTPDGTLTMKGKRHSRVRDIPDHGTFVLWKAHSIALMMAKPMDVQEVEDHDPVLVETEVHDFLMSNAELDLLKELAA